MLMISVMSISGLKIKASAFSPRVSNLIAEVSANIIVSKSVKDQAESPLLASEIRFN